MGSEITYFGIPRTFQGNSGQVFTKIVELNRWNHSHLTIIRDDAKVVDVVYNEKKYCFRSLHSNLILMRSPLDIKQNDMKTKYIVAILEIMMTKFSIYIKLSG